MNQHYRYECGRPPRYQCMYCPSRSKRQGDIYKHVRTKHPNKEVKLVKLYWKLILEALIAIKMCCNVCSCFVICKWTFSFRPNDIWAYFNKLNGTFKFPDIHRQGRKRSRGDAGHQRYHCPKCGRGYLHKSHMSNHYKYECGRPPRYQCPYCHRRSKQPGNMYKHVRTKHPRDEVRLVRLYWGIKFIRIYTIDEKTSVSLFVIKKIPSKHNKTCPK